MNSKQALSIVGAILLVFFAGCGVLGFAGWKFVSGIKGASDCATYGQAGNYDKAIPACREAVRLFPKDANAHNNLGWYLALSGKPAEGLIECKKAVSLNPSELNFLDSVAMAEALSGHQAEALRDSERAYKPDPSPGKQVTYGMALYMNGRHEEAIKEWKQAAESTDPEAILLSKRFLKQYGNAGLSL